MSDGRSPYSAIAWLVIGAGLLLGGVVLARITSLLGHSSGVALVSYVIGAATALLAVAALHVARRGYRAAVARHQARVRWERHQASKQRVRFIDPEQDD